MMQMCHILFIFYCEVIMIMLPYRKWDKPYMQVGNCYKVLFNHIDAKWEYLYVTNIESYYLNMRYDFLIGQMQGHHKHGRVISCVGSYWNTGWSSSKLHAIKDAIIIKVDKNENDLLRRVLSYNGL